MKDVCLGSMVYDESRDDATLAGGAFCSVPSLLTEVRPLRFEEVSRTADRQQWDALVRRWHYLGYLKLVGMQRRVQMAITKAGWNTKVAPSFAIKAEDLEELVKTFGEYYVLFRDCFGRVENEVLSRSYLQGLMSLLERKSMEPMALSLLGESRVKALQKFINVGKWDAEKLGKRHRQEAAKTVSEPGGVFSVDGSDFPKKGTESVSVGRQYCGRLGKVDNCQTGVFAAYSSAKGHALLERKLFLPEQWFDKEHRERWEKCRIPKGTAFKTKPELAVEIIQGLCRKGLFEAQWVTGDDSFGRSPTFRDGLPKDMLYLLDVPSTTRVWKKRPQIHIPVSALKFISTAYLSDLRG